MTKLNRLNIGRTLIAAACFLAVITTSASAQQVATRSITDWSRLVWDSARQGDSAALHSYLREVPDGVDNEQANLLRSTIKRHNDNLTEALATRDEARAEARGKLAEHMAANEISQALSEAVMVQTLSDDLPAAVHDADISKVIAQARRDLPGAKASGDWLLVRDLLYRLNILYEHTAEYQDELDKVNRRVMLLAQYAPRMLYDLRARAAKRMGQEDLAEYNPAVAEDWRQRIDGVKVSMVRLALSKAAMDHIESKGWRPLLIGGLEHLRLFATTSDLAETFPELASKIRVRRWVSHIDDELEQVRRDDKTEINSRRCRKLIDGLLEASMRSIKLPPGVIYREFGDGAMYSLDQFTEIIWPDKLRRFRQSTQGSFVGVGILIRYDDKREIKVASPLEGTPAYYGGIKPDDRIVQVNGLPTIGWTLNDAVDRITGPRGSQVVLGIRREGFDNLINITLERDVIKLRSVKGWWKISLSKSGVPKWNWYIDPVSEIAYIRLTGFSDDSFSDLLAAWKQITDNGHKTPNGLILDLRFNPGGLLSSAVDISNLFVNEGMIVSGEDKNGRETLRQREADPNRAPIFDSGVATVVLVNQGSASASEIVAGCLQAHEAAVVIGHRSYGKGSVQTVHPLTREAFLKLTTQYYRLPATAREKAQGLKGRLVHKRPGAKTWGVEPDIIVEITPQQQDAVYNLRQKADMIPKKDKNEVDQEEHVRPDINEILTKGLDPQLETALLILQAKAFAAMAGDRAQGPAENNANTQELAAVDQE